MRLLNALSELLQSIQGDDWVFKNILSSRPAGKALLMAARTTRPGRARAGYLQRRRGECVWGVIDPLRGVHACPVDHRQERKEVTPAP